MSEEPFFVRQINTDDALFLREMLYNAIYVSPGEPLPPRDILDHPNLARYIQNWGRPGDLGFLAIDPLMQEPVGAAWLRLLSGDNRGYGWVADDIPELSIAILESYRGQGLGTLLLDHLLQAAQAQFSAVSLSVSPDNRALNLYQRLGFQSVGASGTSLILVKAFEPA